MNSHRDEYERLVRSTRVRLTVERDVLPQLFYSEDPEDAMRFLRAIHSQNVGKFMTQIFTRTASKLHDKLEAPQIVYQREEFFSQSFVLHPENEDMIYITRLGMPEPERDELCARIYFCHSSNLRKRACFLLVKHAEEDSCQRYASRSESYHAFFMASTGNFFSCGIEIGDVNHPFFQEEYSSIYSSDDPVGAQSNFQMLLYLRRMIDTHEWSQIVSYYQVCVEEH
ncbi:MAG: hypothetical protein Q4G03_06645 [Planctomycetia bacterium]|nr:hypothetical protein [Planctomycetia bacterium]